MGIYELNILHYFPYFFKISIISLNYIFILKISFYYLKYYQKTCQSLYLKYFYQINHYLNHILKFKISFLNNIFSLLFNYYYY